MFPNGQSRGWEHKKIISYSIARKGRNVKMFEYEISDKAIDSFYGEYERPVRWLTSKNYDEEEYEDYEEELDDE